jgi:PAS domain-containing protein
MSSTLDGKILYQRLKTLLEIFLLTSKTSDYDSVLRIITRYFKIFTDADASVLFLNNDNNNLTPVRSTGINYSSIKDTYISPSTRLKDIIPSPVLDVRYASSMNTPLIQNRKLVGLSAVFSTSPEKFTLFEQNKYENLLLTMLASYIAVIIENITLTNTIITNKIFKLDWKYLFDAVDDLISVHDTNFNIVYANKAVANKFDMAVKIL